MSDWQEMMSADVLTLGMAADEARRAAAGTNVVTYLRVHDVDDDARNAALAVPEKAAEVRVYSPASTFDETIAFLVRLKAAAGTRRVAAFSWADLAERGWIDPAHLRELVIAGMADVAELPVDRVDDVAAVAQMLLDAGAAPRRVTVSHPLTMDRVDVLRRVQRAFHAIPSLRRFSPLPRVAPVDKPTTGYEDVRMVALARLALRERSIEVDWKLYGPKLAQVALTFGADHLDAVSALDDNSLGPRRATVEDVERNVRAAGFEPKEYRPEGDAR